MKKQYKTSPLTILGVAISIIAGIFTVYILIFTKKAVDNLPVGAEVIPEDAMMTLHVSTNSTQWQKLQQFGTSESKTAFILIPLIPVLAPQSPRIYLQCMLLWSFIALLLVPIL